MKVGAEPKKIAILAVLVVVGAYSFYTNVLSDPGTAPYPSDPAPAPAAVNTPPASGPMLTPPPARTQAPRVRGSNTEFRPSLKPRTGEERIDPMSIDPTLRFDLLAKVQSVSPEGGGRNLFQFGAPPPPPLPKEEPKIIPKTEAKAVQEVPTEAKDTTPPKPPPAPIPLKYYGYSTAKGDGRKRAFFLDGEEILVATEGETVKRRYKVVRINVGSVVMEDLDSKNEQTLPVVPEEAVG
jgi:hypothetical protein